jgi:hypothetical protein
MGSLQTSTPSTANERRALDRYPAYFSFVATDLVVSGFIVNISKSGLCVIVPLHMDLGQVVKMEIGDSVLCGEVLYCQPAGDSFRAGIKLQPPLTEATGVWELLQAMLVDPCVEPAVQEPERPKCTPRTTSRRRHVRNAVTGTMRILWRDADGRERILNARVGDASATGVRLQLDERIPVRSYISCNDEACGIRGTGSVRYCAFVRGKYEAGLEFGSGTGWREPR